jgi:hypothetical protein
MRTARLLFSFLLFANFAQASLPNAAAPSGTRRSRPLLFYSLLTIHYSLSSPPSASICVCQSNSRTAIGFSRQFSATFTNNPR